nr:hypothetical protein [Tanacetum cinerariifolium]
MTTSSTNNSVFRSFFEKQKLTGPNFIDWYRQLRIVLSIEDKLNYLEQPIPPTRIAPAGQQVAPEILAAHAAWVKGSKEIAGLLLMTMKPKIQRNLEPLHAHEMLKELLLQNYIMHSMGKTVNELHVMLKLHEQTLNLPKSSAPALHAIQAGKGLRASRKLKPGALSLYVGNGQLEVVEAIGAFYLSLPSGLEIVLNNCHYAPSITRGVIYHELQGFQEQLADPQVLQEQEEWTTLGELLVIRRALPVESNRDEAWLRNIIFHTRCTSNGKV